MVMDDNTAKKYVVIAIVFFILSEVCLCLTLIHVIFLIYFEVLYFLAIFLAFRIFYYYATKTTKKEES